MTWRRTYLLLSVLLSFTGANVAGCVQQSNGSIGSVMHAADHPAPNAVAAPTPTPSPLATPSPAEPVPALSAALRPPTPSPVTMIRYRVQGPGVDVAVAGTVGAPCTAPRPAVPWEGAYFDGCQPGLWIMAHPPFFGAMNSWAIGTAVTYWDGAGIPHGYRIVSSQVYAAGSSGFAPPPGAVHFQVCTDNVGGSPVRVLGAS